MNASVKLPIIVSDKGLSLICHQADRDSKQLRDYMKKIYVNVMDNIGLHNYFRLIRCDRWE